MTHHPAAVCLYFVCALLPVIWGVNPVSAGISLISGILLWYLTESRPKLKSLIFYLCIPAASTVINPLFNHNGVTVLFFLNSNPVTREAVLYGLVLGLIISATLIWARCFSSAMDTDRFLALAGRLYPKLSLVLSISLRFIPLLRRQASATREAQAAAGMRREDNGFDRIRNGALVFSGLTTWALETGILTADSMTARGYGVGRRSRYRVFPWERADTLLSLLSLLLLGGYGAAHLLGALGYTWYPVLTVPAAMPWTWIGYACFLLLCLLGPALEIADRLRWRRLPSEGREQA
jgi:energy-coupling factor transport system permease protein